MPKILVADDSIAVRKVAERLLTEAGLGVSLAANGEEALAYLSRERPDVIVSDVIMPDKSGYEVCAFVRGNAMLAMTPVLLISGIVNDEVTKQAESCQADGVLKKPFQGTSLKDRVLELLAKRQEATPAPRSVAATPSATEGSETRVTAEQLETYRQAIATVKELESQLQLERARSTELATRLSEVERTSGREKELASLLETERERSAQLVQQMAVTEQQVARLQDVEQAFKAEQELTATLRQEGQGLQNALQKVGELDATLNAERVAAAQLVQQLTGLEKAAARAQEFETRLLREEHRATDLEQKAKEAESALAGERARVGEVSAKLAEAERVRQHASKLEGRLAAEQQQAAERVRQLDTATKKLEEVEALLSTERDRNGLLARRVSEAEQAAESATKRFEEMARKLGEIAGLASQLGTGKARS
jgi:DNA-binding response OmpR family regulator